jgi:hypothetical protein
MVDHLMQFEGLWVRIHTLGLMRWSATMIMDRDKLNFIYAGDEQ